MDLPTEQNSSSSADEYKASTLQHSELLLKGDVSV